MRSTLRSKGELRAAGVLLSTISLLGVAGCASEQETATQPSVSTSAPAESPTPVAPEASVQPTETSSPEATITLSDGFVVSQEVATLTGISSIQEAYDIIASFEDGSHEFIYLNTNEILLNALQTGNLSDISEKYSVDKEEVTRSINKLTTISTSENVTTQLVDNNQMQRILEVHMWKLPQDIIARNNAVLLLLDALQHHPNYAKDVQDSIEDCENSKVLMDSYYAEPLGLPVAKELSTCPAKTDEMKSFKITYFPGNEMRNQIDPIIQGMKQDSAITDETVRIIAEFYELLADNYTNTTY